MEPKTPVCRGCGRPELHKMCPAWGTPIYMTGELYTPELEEKYRQTHLDAMEQARQYYKEHPEESGLD